MISVAEASGGFSALTRMYKRLVDEFISQLPLQPQSFPLAPTDNAFQQGMCADTTYVVKGGMLGMRCQERKLFTWDEGDMILPDAGNDEVTYYAESAVLLAAIDDRLAETDAIIDLEVDLWDGKSMAWVYAHGEVIERSDDEKSACLKVRMSPADAARFKRRERDRQSLTLFPNQGAGV